MRMGTQLPMTSTGYTVPDDPADPEAAALDLIVRVPADVLETDAFTIALQDYCGLLLAGRCGVHFVCWRHRSDQAKHQRRAR
jgi:hypothetical protein